LLGLEPDIYLSIVKLIKKSMSIHFVIYRLKSIIITWLLLFFSDGSLPLSRLAIPNPHEKFKFEGQNIIFECYHLY
jgi:hypothetical protein